MDEIEQVELKALVEAGFLVSTSEGVYNLSFHIAGVVMSVSFGGDDGLYHRLVASNGAVAIPSDVIVGMVALVEASGVADFASLYRSAIESLASRINEPTPPLPDPISQFVSAFSDYNIQM